jgi:hypothetical protein
MFEIANEIKKLTIATIRLTLDIYENSDDHEANVEMLQGIIELLESEKKREVAVGAAKKQIVEIDK